MQNRSAHEQAQLARIILSAIGLIVFGFLFGSFLYVIDSLLG